MGGVGRTGRPDAAHAAPNKDEACKRVTCKDDGACELAELRHVLLQVELWGSQWPALRSRLATATARVSARHSQTARSSQAVALLSASESVSDASMSAMNRLSLAGAALLEECESSELPAAAAQPAARCRPGAREWSTSGRIRQLVMKQWDDDRATVLFGMRSGLGFGLGIGAGCAAGWTLLLPLHLTILATTIFSLLVGFMLGPMASAIFGRRADGIVGRICLFAFLCSGGVLWSRVFRPATAESFRDAIVDITTPVQQAGTGQTIGLPRWGCVTATPGVLSHAQLPPPPPMTQPQITHRESDHQAVCAAFYSCAVLELRNAVGNTPPESVPSAPAARAQRRHDRLVGALGYRKLDPIAVLLLVLQSNLGSEDLPTSSSWLPPLFSTVNICGRQFIGVDDSLWWPVPSAPAGELTWEQRQHDHLIVNGFAYRKGRVVHHSLLWQRKVLDWLANLLTAPSQQLQ